MWMRKFMTNVLVLLLASIVVTSCKGQSSNNNHNNCKGAETTKILGAFNADSAYSYIERQVSFGPRVPGSEAHRACSRYIIDRLRSFNADTVMVQNTTLEAYNGDKLPISNIFAGYNVGATNRVLLVAHWDTRPWANMEKDIESRKQPVPGANDGASGVGVLLEIARNLALKAPECGVDLLFVDAEDYGNQDGVAGSDNTWCLGSQYWVEHMPYNSVNRPVFGILLDMVGGTGARFHRERYANINASRPTMRVWSEAKAMGLGDVFIDKVGGAVIDDHIFLTEAGIPTTNIIENMNEVTGDFPPTWHTLDDNMKHISRETLDAVGKTVLNVVYKEKSL